MLTSISKTANRVYCYHNGQFLEEQHACVSINDRGLLLGEGVFETILVANGNARFLPQHWARLADAAKFLHLPVPIKQSQFSEVIEQLIGKNALNTAVIRLTLTAGVGERGLLLEHYQPNLFMQCAPFHRPNSKLSLYLSPTPRDGNNPLLQIKSTNYLNNIIARRQAVAEGYDDALFSSQQQKLTETAVANFFAIVDDVIYTAPVDEGLLPGIMRQQIINASQELGIKLQIKALTTQHLAKISAAFVTNALVGVQAVGKINQQSLGAHQYITQLQSFFSENMQ